jgi:hypothetical protein
MAGIGDRHAPESVIGMARIMQLGLREKWIPVSTGMTLIVEWHLVRPMTGVKKGGFRYILLPR